MYNEYDGKTYYPRLDELNEQCSELDKKLAKETVNLAFIETIIYNRDNYAVLNPTLDNEEKARNTVSIRKTLGENKAKVQEREYAKEQTVPKKMRKNRNISIDD